MDGYGDGLNATISIGEKGKLKEYTKLKIAS